MRAKEVYRTGLKVEDVGGNCYVSAATCAMQYLTGGEIDWNAKLLRSILERTNNYRFAIVARFLEKETGVRFDDELVPVKKERVRSCLTKNLMSGGMGILVISSIGWVRDVVGGDVGWIEPKETHAVLVTGFYEPVGKSGKMWLYVADSYTRKLWFLPFDEVFDLLESIDSRAYMGMLSATKKPRGDFGWWDKLLLDDIELAVLKNAESRKKDLLNR